MLTVPRFEDLLPVPHDPDKVAIRNRLIQVLNSQGEILPSANSPRGKLWRLVNTPGSSVAECAEVIQLDSALASRILRVANSGAYATEAESVSDAVLHLGLKFVREQVFNAGVFKQYSGWVLPPEWDLFWLRNIFIARLSDRIAGGCGATNGSEYLAGLIHDMGWLFVATYFPEQYGQLFASGKPVAEAEGEFLPFSHAEISAAIATRSLLPPRAVEAILQHHSPLCRNDDAHISSAKHANLMGVVLHVCDNVADLCHMDMFGQTDLTVEALDESLEVLWLNHFGQTHDLLQLAEEELAKSKEIFEVYFAHSQFQ